MKLSKIIWCLLVFLCASLCFSLGFWQISRKELKENLIAQRLFSKTHLDYHCGDSLPLYSLVEFKAKLIWSELMPVYTTLNGEPAYKIILPAICNNNKTILVDLGIIAESTLNTYKNKPDQERVINGWIMPTESKPKFISHDPVKDNIWIFIDISNMYDYRHLPRYDFYIRSHDEYQKLPDLRNDHLEYAITWFVLGGFILGLGCLRLYK